MSFCVVIWGVTDGTEVIGGLDRKLQVQCTMGKRNQKFNHGVSIMGRRLNWELQLSASNSSQVLLDVAGALFDGVLSKCCCFL